MRQRLGHVAPRLELGLRRLAEDRRARGVQAAHDLGVVRRWRLVRTRAVSGDLAGDVDVVLDDDRDAEQRTRLAGAQAR